jgi:molecular chaperone DnaK (HSP70)
MGGAMSEVSSEWEDVRSTPELVSARDGQWLISHNTHELAIKSAITQKTYIGIDFGTSTSVVSFITLDGSGSMSAQTLTIEQPDQFGGTIAHHLVNTVLAWHNNRLIFGQDAYRMKQQLFEGKNIFSSFKMRLGVDIGPTYPETALKKGSSSTVVIEDANDATREFFKCLFDAIQKEVGTQNLPNALCFAVSVPASFEANQRRDLLNNILAAGLEISKSCLIDEPNAAFLSFLHQSSQPNQCNQLTEKIRKGSTNILVYDFGAGTCDISILEVDITDKPLKSRNRAISRFTALGGDDFDRAIARKVLLPQLIAETPGFAPELRDIEERLIPRLQPTAERLKVAACKWIEDRGIKSLDQMREQTTEPFVDLPIPGFSIRGKSLNLASPSLSLFQFADILSPFVEAYDPDISTSHVFAPVDDALKKSEMYPDQLDAVLFIGGSAANPVVRAAVMNHLPNSVQEIVPSDLRSHVSLGTALHCLGYHAFGFDLIRPITSEPIFILTRGGGREILMPASSEVPSAARREVGCRIYKQGQQIVELPICVSSENKILGILKVTSSRPEGFQKDEEITVLAHITHDKLLEVEAKITGKTVKAALMNPLANKELTPAEQQMLGARQRFNIALLQYGSRLPKTVVIDYAEAALEAEAFETAADMFAAAERIDPSDDYATNICYAYSRAGKKERANEWAKRAYQRQPSAITAYNLSLWEDGVNKERLLRQSIKFDPGMPEALYNLGEILHNSGEPEGRALLKECINRLKPRLKSNNIQKGDLRILISAADAIDQSVIAEQAKAKLKQLRQNLHAKQSLYDEENLVSSINKEAISKREN